MSTNRSTVESVVQHYFDGLYEGDADKLGAIFDTSADLRWVMWLTVQKGTGEQARQLNYLIGGKTGTADKATVRGEAGPGRGYRRGAVIASFIGAFPIEAGPDLLDHRELLLVRAVEADLGGVDHWRHAVPPVGKRALAARQNAEQTDRDVEGMVVAIEAVGVKDVPRHLAGEGGAHLRHPRLDQ